MGRVPIGPAAIACCWLPLLMGCQPLEWGRVEGDGSLALSQPQVIHEGFPNAVQVSRTPEVEGVGGAVEEGASGPSACDAEACCPGRPGVIARCYDQMAFFGAWLFSDCGTDQPACLPEEEHIHPRFFLVPTRPAFWPREHFPPPIAGGPFPEGPEVPSAPAPLSSIKRSEPAVPVNIHVPEPPSMPAPARSEPRQDRQAEAPRRLWEAGGSENWLFAGESDGRSERATVNQAQRNPRREPVFR